MEATATRFVAFDGLFVIVFHFLWEGEGGKKENKFNIIRLVTDTVKKKRSE